MLQRKALPLYRRDVRHFFVFNKGMITSAAESSIVLSVKSNSLSWVKLAVLRCCEREKRRKMKT